MTNVIKLKPREKTNSPEVTYMAAYLKSNIVDLANMRGKLLKLQQDIHNMKKRQLILLKYGKD